MGEVIRRRGRRPEFRRAALVRQSRWLPFVTFKGCAYPFFLVGGPDGRVARLTAAQSEAWGFDGLPSDDQAIEFVGRFKLIGKGVFALADQAREEIYEFRDYGFRLVEGGQGESQ